jgi:excinuclease UvrABC nuclease subunit
MTMNEHTIHWRGASDQRYKYWILPINAELKDAPGNYIYAKETSPGRWKALYIGQTSSLRHRLASHEKELLATRQGATHIHVHLSSQNVGARESEEADLIANYSPPLNEQVPA